MSVKKSRRITPLELAQLKARAKPVTAAYEALQDAHLIVNSARAAHDALRIPFMRFADALVKKHRLSANEQINQETGAIEKILAVGAKK